MVIDAGLIGALGDGWLGKLVVGLACGAGAWFARRPAEKAVLLDAVNRRVESLIGHLEGEIRRLEQCLKDERERCDVELADMQAKIDRLMSGPIPPYQPKPVRRRKP